MDYKSESIRGEQPTRNLQPLQSPEMPSRLIINADDFGLTSGINRAVAELHRAGVVSSATLMATGSAFEDAVAVARRNLALGVGCHIVLVDGTPISPLKSIPSLLGPDALHFRPTVAAFARDLFFGRINEGEIERETFAQIERLQRAGIEVTHVDTHKHVHLLPSATAPVLTAARRSGVHCFRNPLEPAWSRKLSSRSAPMSRQLQMRLLDRLGPAFRRVIQAETSDTTTSGTLGILATGKLDATLVRALVGGALEFGEETLFELCCHPGYNDADLAQIATRLRASRDIERRALVTVMPEIFSLREAPQLIHYGNLGKTL